MKKYKSSTVLKSALARVKKQNPQISIRALAGKIGVSHVFLSKVIAGKSALPESRLVSFIKTFQLDPFAERELKDAMLSDFSSSKKVERLLHDRTVNKKNTKAIDTYEEHPVKYMTLLANWYELPILDYLTCEGLKKDVHTIAESLSIKPSAVEFTLRKLRDANLITQDKSGEWQKSVKFIRFPNNVPSSVLRTYYTEVLKRAQLELSKDTQADYERRLVINFSIATSADKIPEIKERLSQYMYDLSVEMADGESTEVYNLTMALIPLSKSR